MDRLARGVPAPQGRVADTPELGVVHLTGVAGAVCLDGTAELAAYSRAFGQLRTFALQPAASARLLQELTAN